MSETNSSTLMKSW